MPVFQNTASEYALSNREKMQLAPLETNLKDQCNIRSTTNAVTMEGFDNLLIIFVDEKLQK